MRKLISAVLLAVAVAGCSRTISLTLPPQPLTVFMYSQGKATTRCGVAPGSDKFLKLSEFLKRNSDGWRKRSTNYVPLLVVIGSDINFYFMDDSVVVNYSAGEYSRSITPDQYAFLNCKTS